MDIFSNKNNGHLDTMGTGGIILRLSWMGGNGAGTQMTLTDSQRPPVLIIPAKDTPTGNVVYQGELGLCIMATGDVREQSFYIHAQFAEKYPKTPPVRPHITLIQGHFNDSEKMAMVDKIRNYAQTIAPFNIDMDSVLSPGGGGNTFWNVAKGSSSWITLQNITTFLCSNPHGIAHPVGLMEQVKDDIVRGDGDRALIKQWGRDFSVPNVNNPHITVVYGQQDLSLNNAFKGLQKHHFMATEFALAHIDKIGNIYDIVDTFPLTGTP